VLRRNMNSLRQPWRRLEFRRRTSELRSSLLAVTFLLLPYQAYGSVRLSDLHQYLPPGFECPMNVGGPGNWKSSGTEHHILIGYWHNYVGSAGFMKLRNVSPDFDVIDVAFATPVRNTRATVGFQVDSAEPETEFISDVAYLKTRSKRVLLSIGGAYAAVRIETGNDQSSFVDSVSAIVRKFGFDGIDIDFEGGSLALAGGDIDFKHPTTPSIVNLINALHRLKTRFGPEFLISLTPETLFVQNGFKEYKGRSGAYLPIIYGTAGILSFVHVQDYNSGAMAALDGHIYAQGGADFHVAMTEFLLRGFPVAGNVNNVFPPLPQEKVAFGVPCSPSAAAAGFTSFRELENALKYLTHGIPFGGSYVLRRAGGYPRMRGVMTFSINWDAADGFAFSKTIGQVLRSL
jgi:chitinase